MEKSFENRVTEFVQDHRNWMATAIQECGHHEMFTRRSTGECVTCTLESGFVSVEEALALAYPKSDTEERRVTQVGDREEAPKSSTIKLSDTMVKAILGSVAYGDRMELSGVRTGTVVALMERGVVELQADRRSEEEREGGTVVHHYVLTSRRGHFLLGFLREYPAGREWLTSVLDGPARKQTACGTCGLRVADGSEYHETCRPRNFDEKVSAHKDAMREPMECGHRRQCLVRGACVACRDEAKYLGLAQSLEEAYVPRYEVAKARDGFAVHDSVTGNDVAFLSSRYAARDRLERHGQEWVPATPAQAEPAACGIRASRSVERNTSRENITCARPTGHGGLHRDTAGFNGRRAQWGDNESWQEPTEPVFTVKLWYVTGAFEAPVGAENLCRAVFEEAVSNDRVIAAELHDARGITLEAFGRSA